MKRLLCAVGALALALWAQAAEDSLQAKQVSLDVALAHPTIHLTGTNKSSNYLHISVTGFALPSETPRTPVNLALVIDKSGSMQGNKIEQARQAAIHAVDRLRDQDIVSVVTYDSSVNVVLPATKAIDRQAIKDKIRSIEAGGNTALFAGVSKGAAEVRKFLDDNRVNRVILLSDGLANVGPASPAELEQLGESLIKEGISVSTLGLGLGYNEDLMSRLALASSGNHVFIEEAENMVQVFQNELDDVLSVVAQKLHIDVMLADGIRPVKVLNYPADISGQAVSIDLGQLYSEQQRYFVLEIEVPHGSDGSSREIADVALEYKNMLTETTDRLTSRVSARFTSSANAAHEDVDKEILAACIIQVANEENRRATQLRDDGQVREARQVLLSNAAYLNSNFQALGLEELKTRAALNLENAEKLDAKDWAANRKVMVENQFSDAIQQTYKGTGEKTNK